MTEMLYSLPEKISIDGIFYAVNTDFRIWIEIGNIISSKELNPFEKTEQILKLSYKDTLPPTLEKSLQGIIEFYRCGKSIDNTSEKCSSDMPVIDFTQDFEMIAAAFLHDYNIDLWYESIHWWKFRALFSALGNDNKIVKIMGYRAVNIGDIQNKEQKKFYRKMKSLYKLKDPRTPEEKENDMLIKLNSIFEEV